MKPKAEFLEDKKKTLTDIGKEFAPVLSARLLLSFSHFSRAVKTSV